MRISLLDCDQVMENEEFQRVEEDCGGEKYCDVEGDHFSEVYLLQTVDPEVDKAEREPINASRILGTEI